MKTRIKNWFFFILFPLLLLSSTHSFAADGYHFDFNNRCDAAYESIMSMKMSEGKRLIQEELQQNPKNLIPIFLANYADYLTLMFNGSSQDYKRMKPAMDQRLDLIDQGDDSSPWFNYCKATIYFQQAAIHFRFNEFVAGGFQFRKSFMQLKSNQKRFPDFKYNQVLLGLEEAIVGSAPDSYKWITNMLGMRGSIRGGVAKIVSFLNHSEGENAHLKIDAILYYCFLKFYLLADKTETWRYINASRLDTKNNLLFAYMKANLALDDNKANIAEQTTENRNQSSAYLDVPLFDYQLGLALLSKMDDDAIIYLKRFVQKYTGRLYIKNAYQKMSYYYLTKGDPAQALYYKKKILEVGTQEVDADKNAQRYAKQAYLPNAVLLRAKLNCDGGYFSKALSELAKQNPSDLKNSAEILEYYYRYGLANNLLGNTTAAIPYYEKAISLGRNSQEQYAARSAFELGQLYEDLGQNNKAIDYYNLCLSMKNHDFQSSLDQKAKSGINRLGR